MLARLFTLPVLLLGIAAGPALAQSGASADAPRGDNTRAQLIRNIQREVLDYPHYTVYDSVKVQVDGDTVTLLGKVTMPFKKDDLGERVAKVRGVKTLNNQLEVLPASKSDDVLRVGIANAIYSHPSFDRFTGPDRPIHVIVERGRVTLEGFVNTEADRLAALSIARSFGSFAVTDELKTQAQVRAEQQKKQ